MINEERVRQLYKVALYEQKEEKLYRQTGKYYRSDFIGKEIIKSIFTGTIAYFFMLILFFVNCWDEFLSKINQLDVVSGVIPVVLVYVIYMFIYLVSTYVVYRVRYKDSRKCLDEYEEELQVLNKMYEREEKLKG